MARTVKQQHLWAAVSLLVTAVLVFAYRWLPERQFLLMPHADDFYYLYDDSQAGGGNQASWVDQERRHWRCLRDAAKSSEYCGFNLAFSYDFTQGIDLSKFDALLLDIDFRTQAQNLTLFLRNFDPAYSSPDDGDSAQFIHFKIRPQDQAPQLRIGFDELTLADWWLNQRVLDRQHRSPNFSNITILGIDMGGELPAGNNDLTIKRIAAVGPWISEEHWYLGIISLWWGGSLCYLLSLSLRHRQQVESTQRKYASLEQQHRSLHDQAQTLTEISRRDGLSGLLNRYGLSQALEHWHLPSVAPVTLVLLDIDHFKRINDRRGHIEGDKVICRVAEVIQNYSREQDIQARWGGEEFLLVLPHTSVQQAYQVAEKIRQKVFDDKYFEAKKIAVTVSLGIAAMDASDTFENALRRADECLYRAKAMGRNCCIVETNRVSVEP